MGFQASPVMVGYWVANIYTTWFHDLLCIEPLEPLHLKCRFADSNISQGSHSRDSRDGSRQSSRRWGKHGQKATGNGYVRVWPTKITSRHTKKDMEIHGIPVRNMTYIHRFAISMFEGSLEVKLPTIWTDEKQSRAEAERRERLEERRSEKRKSQKKEDADARKGRKVAKHCFSNDLWLRRVEK